MAGRLLYRRSTAAQRPGWDSGMGMKALGWIGVGVGMVAGAAVSSFARAEGLAGLDSQLNGTGRIGAYAPSTSGIAPPSDGKAARNTRDPAPSSGRIDDEAVARAARPASTGDAEVALTEGRVAACRIEIARRRQVPPAKVAAGTVVLRFTIEANGRVRNAEALSAEGTDLEVAACAKRVLSEWVFAKRKTGPVVVERAYSFGDVSPKPSGV